MGFRGTIFFNQTNMEQTSYCLKMEGIQKKSGEMMMPFLGELMPQHFSLTFHATTNDLDNPRKNALPCHVY